MYNTIKAPEKGTWTPGCLALYHFEKCNIITQIYKTFSKWPIIPHFQGGLHLSLEKLFKISIPHLWLQLRGIMRTIKREVEVVGEEGGDSEGGEGGGE
jgi:hypothetical protein